MVSLAGLLSLSTRCTQPRRAEHEAEIEARVEAERETPAGTPAAHERAPEAATPVAPAGDAAAPSTPSAPPAAPAPAPANDAHAADAAALLLAPDGTPLPQTHELPGSDSVALHHRLEHLVDAIAHDDPERALPAFFPRVAYEQVKAIPNPARDWQQRLVRAFERNIHDYHRQLGPSAAGLQFVALVTTGRTPRWMDPGAEGNRVGYYRLTRTQLRVRLANGTERNLPLTSLISWRGEWYVVHLDGFA
ncbi:MAG TPA: hypothetical protein VMG12_09115 [Polyangiaceae bacterium]|nr:hypothetical protein [Polyangiaceae bacterium]